MTVPEFDPKELRRLAHHGSTEALSFYVQSHLDAILSALAPHAAVRDRALEEAATLCDRKGMYNAYQCANFIRALKGKS